VIKQGGMDPVSQGEMVRIVCADHDACVWTLVNVKTPEMEPVKGDDRAFLRLRVGQNLCVGRLAVCEAGLRGRLNIVPAYSKSANGVKREVLVSEEAGHAGSGLLIRADRLFDFRWVGSGVVPGRGQVFRTEARVAVEELGVSTPEPH
jgi:hypothetical protein